MISHNMNTCVDVHSPEHTKEICLLSVCLVNVKCGMYFFSTDFVDDGNNQRVLFWVIVNLANRCLAVFCLQDTY